MPILKKYRRKISGTYKNQLEKYRLLQDLMDNIPDVIYFKDRKGRLLLVNKAHAKGLGLKPEQVAGKTDFDFFPKERAKMMVKDDQHVFKTGKPIIDKIERATRADGVDNYVSTTKIPRFDEKGRVVGLIGITRDITRRMQLERIKERNAALEKKLRVLGEVNRLKSEFISIASHELRTPLSIVKEAVMLVFEGLGGEINDKQKLLLGRAKNNIERLKKIIEDLLDTSRIESGRLQLHYSLVNLNELLVDSAMFFKKLAREKDIRLEYYLPKQQIDIFVDAERINQIIENLISNAIKFTEEGGQIKVEVKILENKVRVGVLDTGVGITREDLSRLFNKFVQVSKIPNMENKGLGLGLSIAKELVERHGGEIWAESKLGVGSKFYFTLKRFYTLKVLNKHLRDRINSLLTEGKQMYLVNLLVVRYKEFKERIKLRPAELFVDFRNIIETTLNGFFKTEKAEMPFIDARHGECSIILGGATEREAVDFCDLLKERINRYLVKNKIQEAFISLGIISYSAGTKMTVNKEIGVSFCIKEIYIGAEMRRFKRIGYNMDIGILSGKGREYCRTIDISKGGVCFTAKKPLKTDAAIALRLRIPGIERTLNLKGRVAWIKKIGEATDKNTAAYKVGLEFTSLKNEDRRFISKLIKSINKKRFRVGA